MAIDSHVRTGIDPRVQPAPVIENEIPNYRALLPWAIGSLAAGLLSILAFAHPIFLIAAGLAVVFGAVALARLRKQPDLYTGEGLAKTGIVLGLACGISSVTMGTVQSLLLNRRAEEFVKYNLVDVLNKGDVDAALWYRLEPTTRGSMSPEQVRKSFEDAQAQDPMMRGAELGPVSQLAKLLTEGKADLEFVRIERLSWEGTTPVILALLKFTGAADNHNDSEEGHAGPEHTAPGGTQYAAVVLKNNRDGRREEWWVEKYLFPYKPNSYVEEFKPVDDGHGHGGHGH